MQITFKKLMQLLWPFYEAHALLLVADKWFLFCKDRAGYDTLDAVQQARKENRLNIIQSFSTRAMMNGEKHA